MSYHNTSDDANETPSVEETVFEQLLRQEHDGKMLMGALYYAQLGFPVFPVDIITDANGKTRKKPCVTDWQNGGASTNVHQVVSWWKQGGDFEGKLIGVQVGAGSGWGVIDVDCKNGAKGFESLQKLADELLPLASSTELVFGSLSPAERLSPSALARTRSGGLHLWYRLGGKRGVRGRNKIRGLPGLEFKATGQYVVVAPSDGYEWLKYLPAEREPGIVSDDYLATAPVIDEKLIARLLEGGAGESGSDGSHGSDNDGYDDDLKTVIKGEGAALLKQAVHQLMTTPEGEGNNTLYQVAMDLYPYAVLGELSRAEIDIAILDAIRGWYDDYDSTPQGTLNSAWNRTNQRTVSFLPDWPAGMSGDQGSVSLVDKSTNLRPIDTSDNTYKTNYSGAFNSAKNRGLDDAAAAEYATKHAEQAVETAQVVSTAAKPDVFAMLPEELWESRPVFKRIQLAAQSRKASPDAVLHCVLTRLAAMRSHRIVFDSGESDGESSLNFFNVIIGPPGGYKSVAAKTAWKLIDPPPLLAWKGEQPLGTGEGLLEDFMGLIEKETGEINKDGTPKIVKVKEQVLHNALFYVDEGQTLNTLTFKRKDATLGSVLRQLWGGDTTGMTNASEQTSRTLRGGTYSLGIAVGYQPQIAMELINDHGTGLPQRFLWSWSKNPRAPHARIKWPGRLDIDMANLMASELKVIDFPDSVKDEIDSESSGRLRGELPDLGELDGHEPFMLCKIAALLALLDSRASVNEDDWRLAKVILKTSCEIRDKLVQQATDKMNAELFEKQQRTVRTQVASAMAVKSIVDPNVLRIAHRVWMKVQEAGDNVLTEAAVWKLLAARDRPFRDDVMKYLLNQAWIELKEPPTDQRAGAKQSTPLLSLGTTQPRVE